MMSPLTSQLDSKKSGWAIPETSLARSSRDLFHAAERGPTARGHEEGPVSLCEDNHGAMRANEATWQAARFGGYQSLGELLICLVCESMSRTRPSVTARPEGTGHEPTPYSACARCPRLGLFRRAVSQRRRHRLNPRVSTPCDRSIRWRRAEMHEPAIFPCTPLYS